MAVRHTQSKITTLLDQDDDLLQVLFSRNPQELRAEFHERLANGEIYIGSEGCDEFSPITGCPGHPSEEIILK